MRRRAAIAYRSGGAKRRRAKYGKDMGRFPLYVEGVIPNGHVPGPRSGMVPAFRQAALGLALGNRTQTSRKARAFPGKSLPSDLDPGVETGSQQDLLPNNMIQGVAALFQAIPCVGERVGALWCEAGRCPHLGARRWPFKDPSDRRSGRAPAPPRSRDRCRSSAAVRRRSRSRSPTEAGAGLRSPDAGASSW
jgi:hypothetical protein